MSRRRTRPEEIKNKNHYFKRYIAKESLHDHISQNDYESINGARRVQHLQSPIRFPLD